MVSVVFPKWELERPGSLKKNQKGWTPSNKNEEGCTPPNKNEKGLIFSDGNRKV
jgi:hypothetical protein